MNSIREREEERGESQVGHSEFKEEARELETMEIESVQLQNEKSPNTIVSPRSVGGMNLSNPRITEGGGVRS